MHSFLLAAVLPLAYASVDLFSRDTILPRQGGDAFQPGTSGITDSCAPADICGGGDGSQVVCLDRSLGDTCCSENYGCPGGNFCLIKGFCCPDGDDPATCASQNGITLPPSFTPGATSAAGSASSTPSSTSSPASSKAASILASSSTSSSPATTKAASSVAASSATASGSVSGQPSTGNTTVTSPKPATFTGGASALFTGLGGVLSAVVFGLVIFAFL